MINQKNNFSGTYGKVAMGILSILWTCIMKTLL